MGLLSKIDELVLLSIWKLGDKAFGISIVNQLKKDTGIHWASGAIYGILNKIKKNGYITTSKIEKSPELSGRPRIYYNLTELGMEKLIDAQKISKAAWNGIPDLEKMR